MAEERARKSPDGTWRWCGLSTSAGEHVSVGELWDVKAKSEAKQKQQLEAQQTQGPSPSGRFGMEGECVLLGEREVRKEVGIRHGHDASVLRNHDSHSCSAPLRTRIISTQRGEERKSREGEVRGQSQSVSHSLTNTHISSLSLSQFLLPLPPSLSVSLSLAHLLTHPSAWSVNHLSSLGWTRPHRLFSLLGPSHWWPPVTSEWPFRPGPRPLPPSALVLLQVRIAAAFGWGPRSRLTHGRRGPRLFLILARFWVDLWRVNGEIGGAMDKQHIAQYSTKLTFRA
ncbi:hypothetical protein BDP67DRAFT_255745 [Colletotrichum lupini]|nr:hypothetical protein BDP67DRAFT_255745 [Colletotrichum lupini]